MRRRMRMRRRRRRRRREEEGRRRRRREEEEGKRESKILATTHVKPVQGFDYAKKHMGRTGDDAVSVTKDTLVLGLPVRDAPLSLSLDKKVHQDGTASKRPPSADLHKGGRVPSEEDSVSSGGSTKMNASKSSSARRTATGSSTKNAKEELHKRSTNGEEEEEEKEKEKEKESAGND
ncbi:unnamed protein product [Pleuronectes platessa]|uniref:Uncharacterized protein n=1 Tax=Pleuronectes platessa TaxID=8262 RepID=A0A9N7VVN9_PLEPL|nr:unnamed protein product [Pleuronectes platessa]